MIGEVLGHYRVQEKVGSGGMGEVYRATDDRLGREVALKVLKPSLAQDQDRLRRFEQEARAAAALSHPNIVAIYDIGMCDGAPYIVSELLAGQTLRERLLEGMIPIRQVADYALQIAQGLAAAHEKHIVHRDLKPENLFLTRDGRIKILDFGIAKLVNPELEGDRSQATMTTQTRSGSVLGTVAYMSPEQLRGRSVDHRSDIFSFGAILYEMLAGRRAFAGETQVDTMTAILKDDPPEIADLRPGIPAAFEPIVRHCLEKEPENRFQSARDLAFALSTVSNASTSKQIAALRAGTPRLKKWLPWAVAAVLLAAAGVFLGALLKPRLAPAYRQLTFERGTVYSARFSSNGRTIIYGAAWNGRPLQLYSTIPDSLLARPLGLTSAHLLALSNNNELAVALHATHGSRLTFDNGMLARAPLVGGTPREILQDVRWADWSPKDDLAVVHHVNIFDQLEFPIGRVLYRTNGWISHLRISPRGDRIAFMDHPERWNDRGWVSVMDLAGHVTVKSSTWDSEDGLGWNKQGDQVWFAAAESGATNRSLWTMNLSGKARQVLSVPGGFTLHDVAADGRVLVTLDNERLAMEWTGRDNKSVQALSWYDWSVAKDISPDGQSVLFEEGGGPVGESGGGTGPENLVAIRKVDGSPPTHLGDGTVDSLSPDGQWAISVSQGTPSRITLLPVGAGQPRQVPVPGIEHMQAGAHFLPDGERIVFNGNEPGRPGRTFVVDLAGSKPRPLTPEGVYAALPSPDGKYLAGVNTADQKQMLYPVDGGVPREIPGIDGSYVLARWSADGRGLYVYRVGEVPMRIERLDISSGKKTFVRELIPADRAGVVTIAPVVTNADASEFAYSYYQTLSVLYVISGLE